MNEGRPGGRSGLKLVEVDSIADTTYLAFEASTQFVSSSGAALDAAEVFPYEIPGMNRKFVVTAQQQ
jgi:hypothetical protein